MTTDNILGYIIIEVLQMFYFIIYTHFNMNLHIYL